jgi:hypothetical protein
MVLSSRAVDGWAEGWVGGRRDGWVAVPFRKSRAKVESSRQGGSLGVVLCSAPVSAERSFASRVCPMDTQASSLFSGVETSLSRPDCHHPRSRKILPCPVDIRHPWRSRNNLFLESLGKGGVRIAK